MFRNYHAYSTAAKWGIYLYAIAVLISMYGYLRQLGWVSDFYDRQDTLDDSQLNVLIAKSNTFVNTMNQIEYATFLLLGISFLIWIYHSNKNLSASGKYMQYSPVWSVGGYFIPLYNLIQPYKVMYEITAKSEEDLNSPSSKRYFFVGIWWISWITAVVSSHIASNRLERAEDIDELLLATKTVIFAQTMSLIFCAAILYLIHRVYNMQLADPVLNRIIEGTQQQRPRRSDPRA